MRKRPAVTTALTTSTAPAAPTISGQSRDQRVEVDAHADRDQEDAEREAGERRGDRLDLGMVIGLGDQDAGDQRAKDRRQARPRSSPGWRG